MDKKGLPVNGPEIIARAPSDYCRMLARVSRKCADNRERLQDAEGAEYFTQRASELEREARTKDNAGVTQHD